MSRTLLWASREEVPSSIQEWLREKGFQWIAVRDGVAALRTLETTPVAGLVVFQELPGLRGDEICRVLWSRREWVQLPVIWVTGETLELSPPEEACVFRLEPGFSLEALGMALESVGLAPPREKTPEAASPSIPGLEAAQVETLVRDVVQKTVEQVVWEVVPTLAERLIREEIRRLLDESPKSSPNSGSKEDFAS